MRWIKAQSLLLLFLLLGCRIEVHEATYDNPFDLDANKEKGIIPPALIFSPSRVKTTVGGSATMDIFALEVSGVGGVHARPEITVSGTGDIAVVVFNVKTSGEAIVRYTSESELLGSNDVPIKLNGLGQGVVNAK